jgi:hypothetical protein
MICHTCFTTEACQAKLLQPQLAELCSIPEQHKPASSYFITDEKERGKLLKGGKGVDQRKDTQCMQC